jgi:hypothetical protein
MEWILIFRCKDLFAYGIVRFVDITFNMKTTFEN